MRIIVIGDGKVGSTLIERLSKEDHDIVVVDTNPKVIENAVNSYDVMGVVGNGASYTILKEAEADKADIIIAATNSDELNILACLVAKKIGAKHTIARVRSPEYSKQLLFLKNELGLSMVINPEYETAAEIYRILRFPSAIKLDVFCKGKVEMAEVQIGDNSILDNVRLIDLYDKIKVKVIIGAVQRGEDVFIPKGNFVIKNNDIIHITASHRDLSEFLKVLGIYKEKLKNIMIIGGGKIAYYLATMLSETNMNVAIVEIDEKRCIELSETLPKARIVYGNGTDQMLLAEEGIYDADAVIPLMGIDEENIILSLYANKQNVPKTITKINNSSLVELLGTINTGSIVSPRKVTADRIVRYARALQNSEGSMVNTLYRIVNNRAEALEFLITDNSLPVLHTPLKDLKFKQNILVACIIRNNKLIYPVGKDTIEVGDNVIIISPAEQYIKEFQDIME
ncbi:MAG TPA: Trk system potassium transporter TrkA [Clostridia bacterium]|nr:MAG: Trk system potassium uptake protein TrkA [Firmicutes bacterium ADurb.Bin146]HOD93651.1 Trk system potassium transporter TrkA [Clostridia bacterium]HQM39887.1 Trk system potassium transporter TrkA [Clostridia bacterium]